MFFKVILNKIIGYVRINVEGFFIERFINLCKTKNILLWGIKREKASIMHTNIGIKDFKKVKEISNKTKCRVRIEKKKGLPFLANRYRKRKILAFGFVFIFGIIIYTSNFIWNVEIVGNEKINSDELKRELSEEGLKVGAFKRKVNKDEIINAIRYKRDDLSWVGINIKGTNAIVKVVETDKKPAIVDEEAYCNIIADKDGIIEKIDVTNGTSVVKKGDMVKKGDILIEGWMEGKYTGIRYVHSSGNIVAKVSYSEVKKVDLSSIKSSRTGKSKKKYSIKFNNFKINLYKKLSNFEKYDTIYTTKRIKIFSDFYIPVEIEECNIFEIKENEVKYSREEAKEIAIKQAEEELQKKLNTTEIVENKNVNINETDEFVEAEVVYEVIENIGTEEKIVF